MTSSPEPVIAQTEEAQCERGRSPRRGRSLARRTARLGQRADAPAAALYAYGTSVVSVASRMMKLKMADEALPAGVVQRQQDRHQHARDDVPQAGTLAAFIRPKAAGKRSSARRRHRHLALEEREAVERAEAGDGRAGGE